MEKANSTSRREKRLGILYVIGAAFGFACMNLLVKAAGDLPFWQKAFFRNFVVLFVAVYLLQKDGNGFAWKKGNLPDLVLRSVCGTVGLICNFYAIDHLGSIADASMLNKLSPFFAILFSVPLLHEKARPLEWGATLLAFVGALFVIKPGLGVAWAPAMIGALGGMGAGLAYVFVRRLGKKGERGPVIVLAFSLFSCIVTVPPMLVGWKPMAFWQVAVLLAAGAGAAMGQLCITAAYTHAPAKEISVFDYTQVLFAAVLGFFFLHEMPDGWSFLGYAIIIGVAAAKWQYNLKH